MSDKLSINYPSHFAWQDPFEKNLQVRHYLVLSLEGHVGPNAISPVRI